MGIGGMGMGTLAGLLVTQGHRVSGSDTTLYPPMSDQLRELGITPCDGYRPDNLTPPPDQVVVGNVIRRDNPEAQALLQSKIPYLSLPQALQQHFLEGKEAIVIAGTHGKSTTTVLAGWLLESAGKDPGLFAGAVAAGSDRSYRLGRGSPFVIEGDEYDSAFFDKRPKFCNWRPAIGVLTSAEFDHADIYQDWEAVRSAFVMYLATLEPAGRLIACADDPRVREIIKQARCPVVTYGIDPGAQLRASEIRPTPDGMTFLAGGAGLTPSRFRIPLWGACNVRNALAAIAVGLQCGLKPNEIARGLESFAGLKRRQELVGSCRGIQVIDDFAHHPTAIRETVASIRQRFPGLPVWAIFEPRSNTSRRNIFQREFALALGTADVVVLSDIWSPEKIPAAERLDVARLVADLKAAGRPAWRFPDSGSIAAWLPDQLKEPAALLFMSNGHFGNLPRMVWHRIDAS